MGGHCSRCCKKRQAGTKAGTKEEAKKTAASSTLPTPPAPPRPSQAPSLAFGDANTAGYVQLQAKPSPVCQSQTTDAVTASVRSCDSEQATQIPSLVLPPAPRITLPLTLPPPV